MPEARVGLKTGKVPRRAGLTIELSGLQFTFTLNAETLAVGAAKLPDVPEADTPRVLFEERIALLRELWKTTDSLLDAFAEARCGSSWEGQTSSIRRWITAGNKPVAAVA